MLRVTEIKSNMLENKHSELKCLKSEQATGSEYLWKETK